MGPLHLGRDVSHGPPYVIGWKEYVAFVAWPLRRVRAKIDTGARTSALDVLSYELREGEGGLLATLRLALDPRRNDRIDEVVTPVLKMVVVCNSSGMREQRALVETTLRL